MEVRFHRRVQVDLNAILKTYYQVSPQLGDDFYAEFQVGISKALKNPSFFHFDRSGHHRCNLDRFPYHFLYDIREHYIQIWVLRHNRRDPDLGFKRFSS